MYAYRIYFGVGEDRDRQPIPDLDRSIKRIKQAACSCFGGFTLVESAGGWLNPEGIVVEEKGYVLTILTSNNVDHVTRFAHAFILMELNQAEIMLELPAGRAVSLKRIID